jgi:glycosyltransferase involved in cell wall biosynthesis
VAILPQLIPSTTLTVVKPLVALYKAGHITASITLEGYASLRRLAAADVVVFSRNSDPVYRALLEAVVARGTPFIYDLDDNLFELPAPYLPKRSYDAAAEQQLLTDYLQSAALVQVYSQPMLERVRVFNPRTVLTDALIDWSLAPSTPPRRDAERVRIVYATSRIEDDELAALFLAGMRKVLSRYPHAVELDCWGYHPPELRDLPSVRFLKYIDSYDKFFHRFARSGFDIGLAPLRDETFYRSKTNNKFREYAACRIAGVYSDVEVYNSCVEHERTGLLVANTPDAWCDAVMRLIEDRALRERIQEQALAYVQARYSSEKTEQQWLLRLTQVVENRQMETNDTAHSSLISAPAGLEPFAISPRRHQQESRLRLLRNLWRRVLGFVRGVQEGGIQVARRKILWTLRTFRSVLRLKWMLLRAAWMSRKESYTKS